MRSGDQPTPRRVFPRPARERAIHRE
jgi:hypothetical protein